MEGPALRIAGGTDASPFSAGVAAWLNDLDARGRTRGTRAQYEEQINRIAREAGWSCIADVSYESAVAWLAEQRRGGWKGATYKRAATALRSFGRSLSKAKLTQGNVLEHIESKGIVSGDGSRPLELWEAQAIVAAAGAAERASRRCRGTPSLFWTFLFLSGFRYGEASDLRWRQVDFDEGVLWSNPEVTKNKTRMAVGLCPELAALLGAHRAKFLTVDDDRPVFEYTPKRETWHQHREAGGVPATDRHGAPATPHSARKSFHVWLGAAGVPETIVEALMRHVDTVGRKSYNRPFLQTLTQAAAKLPTLNEKSPGFVVAERPGGRYIPPATRDSSETASRSQGTMVQPSPNTITANDGMAPRTSGAAGTSPSGLGEATFGAVPSSAVDSGRFSPAIGEGNAEGQPRLNDPNRLRIIEKTVDGLTEALRQLRGPAALLLLAACAAREPHNTARTPLPREESASRVMGKEGTDYSIFDSVHTHHAHPGPALAQRGAER